MLLILRHEPFEHLGHFAGVLDDHKVAYRYHDLGTPFSPDNYRGVIAMGGPMSANDDLPVNCSYVGTLKGPIDPHLDDLMAASKRILESWLNLV